MAYLAVPLFSSFALVAGYGYLKFTSARARERAGLPPRVPVKLPLYWWALYILLLCLYHCGFVLAFSRRFIGGRFWSLSRRLQTSLLTMSAYGSERRSLRDSITSEIGAKAEVTSRCSIC